MDLELAVILPQVAVSEEAQNQPKIEPPISAEPAYKQEKSRSPDARTQAAAKVGVSGKTVDEAEKIEKSAPELFAQMQRGEKTLAKT